MLVDATGDHFDPGRQYVVLVFRSWPAVVAEQVSAGLLELLIELHVVQAITSRLMPQNDIGAVSASCGTQRSLR